MPSPTYHSLVEGEHPKPSDCDSLRIWEKRWDDYLEKIYSIPLIWTATQSPVDDLIYNIHALLVVAGSGEEIQRLCDEGKMRELLWSQQIIARASLPLAELTWRALPRAKREEVVLLAIDQALHLDPAGFKLRWMMTPEVTVKKLAADDSQGGTFLALLRPIAGQGSIREPIFTPHYVFDMVCLETCEEDATSIRIVKVNRAIALSHIIWNILCVTVCS